MTQNTPKEFEEEMGKLQKKLYWLFEESGWSGVLNTLGQRSKEECIGSILNSVEYTLHSHTETVRRERNEVLESLCDMWEQYCPPPHTHMYMSAGEGAEVVLQQYGLLKSDGYINWKKLQSLEETE